MGVIIDSTCILWKERACGEKGSCLLYDTDQVRKTRGTRKSSEVSLKVFCLPFLIASRDTESWRLLIWTVPVQDALRCRLLQASSAGARNICKCDSEQSGGGAKFLASFLFLIFFSIFRFISKSDIWRSKRRMLTLTSLRELRI